MIVLIDIDHTLSDAAWRDGMIADSSWDDYHAASEKDEPVKEMVDLVNSLESAGHEVIGFTTRPERWRSLTIAWMVKNEVNVTDVLMRRDDDYRPAEKIKSDLFDDFLRKENVGLIIDDNEATCAAFRAKGITTLCASVRGK